MNAQELETKTREIANLALSIAGQLAGVRSVTSNGAPITLPTLDRSGAVVGALSLESAIRAWREMARTAPQSAREALSSIKAQSGARGIDTPEQIQGESTSKDDGPGAGEIVVAALGFLTGILDAVTGKKDTGTGTGSSGSTSPGGSKPPASDKPSGLAAVPTWAWAVGGLLLAMFLTGRVPAAR